MKNSILLFTVLLLFTGIGLQAQRSIRVGYFDMEYILQNVPEYQQASQQLNERVQEWKKDVEKNQQEIEAQKTKLENERALLTEELIRERKEDIRFLEQQAIEYQQNRFGPNGDYMMQKKQLVRPIQDQVFTAVREIAKNRNLDLIFDRSAGSGIVYVAEEFDISDQILRSINRASSRRQVNNKEELERLEEAENRTSAEDAALKEEQEEIERRKKTREELIEERRNKRDSIRAAKKRQFQERRERILKERQARKDSIEAARENEKAE